VDTAMYFPVGYGIISNGFGLQKNGFSYRILKNTRHFLSAVPLNGRWLTYIGSCHFHAVKVKNHRL
jgi:hypothetical protein